MRLQNLKWLGMVGLAVFPLNACFAEDAAPAPPVTAPAVQPPAKPAPLPANLSASSAEVLKLSEAGMGGDVILAYIAGVPYPFNLSANDILYLKDGGRTFPDDCVDAEP